MVTINIWVKKNKKNRVKDKIQQHKTKQNRKEDLT